MKNTNYRSAAAGSIPLHEEWWALRPPFPLLRQELIEQTINWNRLYGIYGVEMMWWEPLESFWNHLRDLILKSQNQFDYDFSFLQDLGTKNVFRWLKFALWSIDITSSHSARHYSFVTWIISQTNPTTQSRNYHTYRTECTHVPRRPFHQGSSLKYFLA